MTDQQLTDQVLRYICHRSKGDRSDQQYSVTINFHPNRSTTSGQPLLLALASDGVLRSQFETATSNGGLSAYPGGKRWQWEHKAFNGLYDHCSPEQRPKYGGLNHQNLVQGACPRFGSACFRLRPHTLYRTTFCFPDSYFNPEDSATREYVSGLIKLADATMLDSLDNYIEAHIHGTVNLQNDVTALVLDPVYRDTPLEKQARQLPVDLQWHAGYRLPVSTVAANAAFRGKETVKVARQIAVGGFLDPLILDMAHASGHYDPQAIKKVWHYLAKYGYNQHHEQPQ